MKFIHKLTALILLVLSTCSCVLNIGGIKGNQHVTTEERSISSKFETIDVSHGIKVYLTMGEPVSLTLEADENLHDIIRTEVQNGVLRIYAEENIWRAKARRVYLTAPKITAIEASSGSDVISENTITADHFNIKSSSGSDVRLHLNVEDLYCSSSSGSDIKVEGKAKFISAKASSGSSIKASHLKAETGTAKVSSGADIDVYVSHKLDAKASSGGDIDYRGNPEIVNKNKSSGGRISKD